MRKYISLMLCLCLCLTMAACQKAPQVDTTPATTTAATTTVIITPTETEAYSEAEYDTHTIAISFPLIKEEEYLGDDLIFQYHYPDVTLNIPDADIAQIITLDLMNQIDSTTAAAEQIKESAKKDLADATDFYPYNYLVHFSVTRLDQNILSILCTETSYDGSPRSLNKKYTLAYDLATGNRLSLKAILQTEFSADVLSDMIIAALKNQNTDEGASNDLFPDYETTVRDKFATNTPVESWYLSADGLCIYFEPYEIAAYSEGEITATIPYSKLSGMMNEQYFLTEQHAYIGAVDLKDVTGQLETAMSAYNRFSELTLESGSNQLLLTCDGSVTDISILFDDGSVETMLYASAGMGPNDAVLIECNMSKLNGSLIVRYRTDHSIRQAIWNVTSDALQPAN